MVTEPYKSIVDEMARNNKLLKLVLDHNLALLALATDEKINTPDKLARLQRQINTFDKNLDNLIDGEGN